MRDIGAVIAAVAVALAWLLLWGVVFRALGIRGLQRNDQERASRREHMKQLGKLRYILLFGVFGYGLALGLALTVADFILRDSFEWGYELSKLVLSSIVAGLFQGVLSWGREVRDPVQFPPHYPRQN